MRNRYRIVYYVPSFRHGSRFALGVIVETSEGITYIKALRWPPNLAFNLGQSHENKMSRLWERLQEEGQGVTRSLIPFTPLLILGEVRHFPATLQDVLELWFQTKILPR